MTAFDSRESYVRIVGSAIYATQLAQHRFLFFMLVLVPFALVTATQMRRNEQGRLSGFRLQEIHFIHGTLLELCTHFYALIATWNRFLDSHPYEYTYILRIWANNVCLYTEVYIKNPTKLRALHLMICSHIEMCDNSSQCLVGILKM